MSYKRLLMLHRSEFLNQAKTIIGKNKQCLKEYSQFTTCAQSDLNQEPIAYRSISMIL